MLGVSVLSLVEVVWLRSDLVMMVFFFKQKTAYEI